MLAQLDTRDAAEADKDAVVELVVEAWFATQSHVAPGGDDRPSIEPFTRD